MIDPNTIALNNIDPDDISDVLVKIQQSFGFSFGSTELRDVKTFGELCDIIINKVQGNPENDCTTQQAFYKLRDAIAVIQSVDKKLITPETNLEQVFPRHNRIRKIKELQHKSGMPVDILTIKQWLGWTIFIGIVGALIMFFFKWYFALGGLAFFIAVNWTANKFFANEFKLLTVGELAEKITREHYLKARRNGSTINRNEVVQIVKDLLCK